MLTASDLTTVLAAHRVFEGSVVEVDGGEQAVETVGAPLAIGLPVALERPLSRGRVSLAEYVRVTVTTQFHPCGTARMGPAGDAMAVVDQHGVRLPQHGSILRSR
jgi:choline dehydrogenase-like flavoprotein